MVRATIATTLVLLVGGFAGSTRLGSEVREIVAGRLIAVTFVGTVSIGTSNTSPLFLVSPGSHGVNGGSSNPGMLWWAVGFFFGNTELSLELWNVIAGGSGFDD